MNEIGFIGGILLTCFRVFFCFWIVFRHSEYVAELFFLQNNGNMMEYPTWRKKSNTQQFINFMKSHRLDPPPLEESEQSVRQVCCWHYYRFHIRSIFHLIQIKKNSLDRPKTIE